ncbi:DUF2845 domain-containing protein [Pseudomonas sp. RC10]|uniref:DUF2845 domain-containing protein n=1 Tax=Pseudomonas bambusae TaxID=3139142 RepID=UPI0031396EB9
MTVMILMALTALGAQASMRCENGIASEGDSTEQVLQKCGAPASREPTGMIEDRRVLDRREFIGSEEWVYGPRGGMYQYLRFEGSKLVRIRSQR